MKFDEPAHPAPTEAGGDVPKGPGQDMPAKRGSRDMKYLAKSGTQKTHPAKPSQPNVMRYLPLIFLALCLHACTLVQSQPLIDATTAAACAQASQKMNADERGLAVRQLDVCRGVLVAAPVPTPAP